MKTTTNPLFSNGTEWMDWLYINCDRCWKQSHEKKDGEYTAIRCSIEADILAQAAGVNEIRQRSYDIVNSGKCPFRQAEKPKYARKPRRQKSGYNEPILF